MATRVSSVLPPLLVVLMLSLAAPAAAQRVLLTRSIPGSPPTTELVDLAAGVATVFSNDLTQSAVFLSDGTVLVRRVAGEAHWRVRFVASGLELPLPGGFAPDVVGLASVVVPHPRALAVFGLFRDTLNVTRLARIDAAGLHVLAPCGSAQPVESFDVTADGEELFVLCNAPAPDQALVVVDSATGQERRRVPIGDSTASAVVVLGGAREFLTVRATAMNGYVLARADAATGAVLQSVPFGAVLLMPNPRRRDQPVYSSCVPVRTTVTCRVHAIDVGTLATGPQLGPHTNDFPVLSFLSGGRDAVVSGGTVAAMVSLATGLMATAIPASTGGWIRATIGAEPDAPLLAPPVVTGNTVALSWTLPIESTAVSGYRLEAGSQPGLADILTTTLGPAPSFAAAGVPPGRYVVRVRAVNANGTSQASNEVIVDVP